MNNVIYMYPMSVSRVLRVQIMVIEILIVLVIWLIYLMRIVITIEVIWILLSSIIKLLSSGSRFVNIFTITQFKKLKCLSILFSDIVNSS